MHVYLLIPVTIQERPTEKGKGQNFAVLSLTDAMERGKFPGRKFPGTVYSNSVGPINDMNAACVLTYSNLLISPGPASGDESKIRGPGASDSALLFFS
jgi:hypothetical protein